MKKLIGLSAVTFILAAVVNAQTAPVSLKSEIKLDKKKEAVIKKEKKEERKEFRNRKGYEVSYQVKEAFIRDFGNIPGTQWERLDNFDEATFTKDGQVMSAFYDSYSKLVGTTTNKTFADLPANAQKFISEKYKGYTEGDVLFFDDNEFNDADMILFGTEFNDADNYFVEMKKDNKKIVLQVEMDGYVTYFARLR